jgi:sugar transferase (PEP-CTERM/EpsH1 system associated)
LRWHGLDLGGAGLVKILVLAPDVPATSKMPGSPRLFNLCRELSRNHQLLLSTFCSSRDRYETFLSDPTQLDVFQRVDLLPEAPAAGWLGQQWHRLNLAAHFETRYRNAQYNRSIRSHVRNTCARDRIDLIYADILPMTQYVDEGIGVPAIVDLHDSLTLLFRRTLSAERSWRTRLSAYLGLISVKRLERDLEHKFDLAITNSAVDERVIRELTRELRTLTISNGVDMDYFSPGLALPEPDTIVFTGVMDYAPNEDAALYFGKEIFPLVKMQRPQAQYWIVGSNPSARIKDLTHDAGIHVTGSVDDVRPYVRRATVFVSPLRVGSGVKNKILAALAMEKATVATPLSVDGLDVAHGNELLLAEDAQSFAGKVLQLLADHAERRRLGANGLACVRSKYSWRAMGEALDRALQAITAPC